MAVYSHDALPSISSMVFLKVAVNSLHTLHADLSLFYFQPLSSLLSSINLNFESMLPYKKAIEDFKILFYTVHKRRL